MQSKVIPFMHSVFTDKHACVDLELTNKQTYSLPSHRCSEHVSVAPQKLSSEGRLGGFVG